MIKVSITIHKAAMLITNIGEEMRAIFWDEYRHSDAFDWCIAPSMIVDATFAVDVVNIAAVISRQPHR